MTRTARLTALAVLAPLALSACGGGGGGGGSGTGGSGGTTATFQSKFGSSFAAFFDTSASTADANVKHPTVADVPSISLSGEPIDN